MPKVSLTPFTVSPRSMHELIVMPQFADVLDDNGTVTMPSPEEGDWAIMDDVVVSRPIIDLFGKSNILKRRDATCKIIYSSVGRMSDREIRTTKLYAGIEDCAEEFYQGAFEDWSAENFDVFGSHIMPLMDKAVATDLYTNKYFGDVTRASDVNGIYSWNRFDGIFTWYFRYIADGTIPAAQTFAIAGGDITPSNANAALASAFGKQDGLFKLFPKKDKVIYVDEDLAEAYWDYVVAAGQSSIQDRMSGKATLYFKGIEVKTKLWSSTLAALNGGTAAHVVILTLRGNWLFAADSKYGGGPRRNEAIRVWYSMDDDVWRRQLHMKAGTQIIAPQHTVIGITSF